MAEPLVSVLVPTLERAASLAACLDSIAATVDAPHEVVCISVGGDTPTQRLLRDRPVRNIVEDTRGGFVAAMNLGLRAARGIYVAHLNDDCRLLPHAIDNAVRFLEVPAHAGVGQAAFFHDTPVRRNVHTQIDVEDTRYVVAQVRGLCYANFGLARRDLYERLGYYDERYFMYGADPDFSLKVWHEAGLAVAPCPGSLVHHAQLEDERAGRERGQQADDNRKLFAKWGLDAGASESRSAPASRAPAC
ncbi:MAG: glycosyltransferase [Phycisphaerales bacterium]|nr:glycosyltransferase [Phycisphaerales bacterium]